MADYTARLASTLRASGLDVRVLVGSDHPSSAGEPDDGPPVARLPSPVRSWGLLPAVARHVGRRRSVVHIEYQTAAFGMHPAINLLPLWLRRVRPHTRTVVTCHDVRVPYLFPKAGPIRGWITRLMINACHAATFADAGDRAWAGDRAEHTLVPIGSGVPVRSISDAERRESRARLAGDADAFLLGYFGFLNATKGLTTLLESLARLDRRYRPVRLVFVGEALGYADETNAAIRRDVDAAIRSHGLGNRVTRTGPLSLSDLSATLQVCDALVFPFDDGASFRRSSLAAALAHGCPIVTTLRPDGQSGIPGIEHGRDVLLVPPANAAALCAALERLRDDEALRQTLGSGARQAARALAWPVIGQAITRAYATALGVESVA